MKEIIIGIRETFEGVSSYRKDGRTVSGFVDTILDQATDAIKSDLPMILSGQIIYADKVTAVSDTPHGLVIAESKRIPEIYMHLRTLLVSSHVEDFTGFSIETDGVNVRHLYGINTSFVGDVNLGDKETILYEACGVPVIDALRYGASGEVPRFIGDIIARFDDMTPLSDDGKSY